MPLKRDSRFFVGIGAAKAGTTWLASYLRRHPQVFVSPLKELHYFDELHLPEYAGSVSNRFLQEAKRLASRVRSPNDSASILRLQHLMKRLEMNTRPRAYIEYFQQFGNAKHHVFGEITPSYAMLGADGFQSILRHYPRAKLIFILRNPVDRYWSHLKFAQKLQKDFDPAAQFEHRIHDQQFSRRTRYDKTFEALDQVVPGDQVFTTFYEFLFGANNQQELARLCEFLGIDAIPGDFGTIFNQGSPTTIPESGRHNVVRHFLPTYEFVVARFGGSVPESWIDDLEEVS